MKRHIVPDEVVLHLVHVNLSRRRPHPVPQIDRQHPVRSPRPRRRLGRLDPRLDPHVIPLLPVFRLHPPKERSFPLCSNPPTRIIERVPVLQHRRLPDRRDLQRPVAHPHIARRIRIILLLPVPPLPQSLRRPISVLIIPPPQVQRVPVELVPPQRRVPRRHPKRRIRHHRQRPILIARVLFDICNHIRRQRRSRPLPGPTRRRPGRRRHSHPTRRRRTRL